MNEYIKSDLYRYTGKTSWLAFWKLWLSAKKFRWQVGMRTCQQLYRGGGIRKVGSKDFMETCLYLAFRYPLQNTDWLWLIYRT